MSEYRTYAEYLRHPRYRFVRGIVMTLADWRCQRCGERATEVHHLRYPPWGTFDVPENLEPVCHQCHCNEHGKEN